MVRSLLYVDIPSPMLQVSHEGTEMSKADLPESLLLSRVQNQHHFASEHESKIYRWRCMHRALVSWWHLALKYRNSLRIRKTPRLFLAVVVDASDGDFWRLKDSSDICATRELLQWDLEIGGENSFALFINYADNDFASRDESHAAFRSSVCR